MCVGRAKHLRKSEVLLASDLAEVAFVISMRTDLRDQRAS